jgi:nucleoside-diphosphate-sugar epimerase
MIVVTGATGLLGNNLVRLLIKEAKDVRAMVLPGDRADALDGLAVETAEGDVTDLQSLTRAFEGAERVYHCAAVISIVSGKYKTMEAVNVRGVRNVIEACRACGVKKLVHVASVEAFGNDGTGQVLSEKAGFRPDCAMIEYGKTKAYGGMAVLDAVAKREIEASIVAPVGIIGPNDFLRSRMSCMFRDYANRRLPAYVKDGGFDFVDARDVARCIIAADHRGGNGETYLCSAGHITMQELMDYLQELTGMPKPRIAVNSRHLKAMAPLLEKSYQAIGKEPLITRGSIEIMASDLRCDPGKSIRELGMRYIGIRQSIKDTVEWLEAQGDLKKKS